jgi:hypothetical protein
MTRARKRDRAILLAAIGAQLIATTAMLIAAPAAAHRSLAAAGSRMSEQRIS